MIERRSSKRIANKGVILFGVHLTKSFGGLEALKDLDFQLYEGEILGLIGPNGAGKTTLFNLIAGVHKPDYGSVYFRNEIISGLRPDQICKKGIGRTFQIGKPFLRMTLLENVMVGAYFGGHRKTTTRESRICAEEVLSRIGLGDKLYSLASQLSLGERKRLEVARALSTFPSVLLLDEVIAGLSPTETLEMVELIKKIRGEGISVLMIEHVMKAVMRASDRIIVLQYGQKIADDSPEEVASNKNVITAYLGGGFDAQFEQS